MASKRKQQPQSAWRWLAGEVIGLIRQFGNSMLGACVTCFLIYSVAHTFQAFAGRISVADLALKIAANLNVAIAASLTLSGVTTVLWGNECRRHRNTRKRLTERTQFLELKLDKNRASSLLTRKGTTREGDQ